MRKRPVCASDSYAQDSYTQNKTLILHRPGIKEKLMNRPLIAVNTDLREEDQGTTLFLRKRYVDALWKAGAQPVLLPCLDADRDHAVLAKVSGLLLTGGDDMDPALYGGKERHEKEVPLHPIRERFDFDLVKAAVTRGLPILAICLGLQELCVAFGGTIVPYIPDCMPDAIEHQAVDGKPTVHALSIASGSRLSKLLKDGAQVNSAHRQAIGEPGQGLSVSARTEDGVIEAVESEGEPFYLGVQWHPELLLDDPAQFGLFKALVEASVRFERE